MPMACESMDAHAISSLAAHKLHWYTQIVQSNDENALSFTYCLSVCLTIIGARCCGSVGSWTAGTVAATGPEVAASTTSGRNVVGAEVGCNKDLGTNVRP